jgi:hypothetical protein
MLKTTLNGSSIHVPRTLSALSAALCASLLGMACSSEPAEGVGTVHIAIVEVPSDVQCIQITADGSRTISKNFDVMPGQSSILVMNAVPAGTVLFSGDAFPTSCSALPTGAIPNWTSDETPAEVIAGAVNDVRITMRRTGIGNITVDFEGEADTCAGISCDDGNPCTVDRCDSATGMCSHVPDPACGCTSDADCNDGVACTVDRCDAATRTCSHIPDPACGCTTDAECNDSVACTVDICDTKTGSCLHDSSTCGCTSDAQCDDGQFCNGREVCSAGACVVGLPVVCSPNDVCTTSTCNEATNACVSQPTVKQVQWSSNLFGSGVELMRCAERQQVFSDPSGINGFCELNSIGLVRAQLELAGTSVAGPFGQCSFASDGFLVNLQCCVN